MGSLHPKTQLILPIPLAKVLDTNKTWEQQDFWSLPTDYCIG